MLIQPFCIEGNLLRMQPVALHQRAKAHAAQTKPARAGVRCRASAELHLTANAGRCELNSWARMRTAGSALAVKSGKCSCSLSAQKATCCGCSLLPCTNGRKHLLHKRSPPGLECGAGQVLSIKFCWLLMQAAGNGTAGRECGLL